ncbi:MAG: UDP-3-O-acyl-N-acetylglucosamine deacetylase, partial [Longimicrobiales bacterium]|nr:UDP-3-O-acyl-N-acetylglucosamine deacetylase [Longimicrobiales bacterium]
MSDEQQKTLSGDAALSGVGVHSGEESNVRIRPAETDTGIVFRRTDLEGAPEIPGDLDHVVGTELGTTLGVDDTRILTVEHLMAALFARGVTNAVVEVDGPELPIGDGSFGSWIEALDEAGVVEQDAEAPVLTLKEPVSVEVDGGASYVVAPAESFRISGTIDYPHDAIGRQYGSFEVTEESFAEEIAPARTFGFKADAEALWERGLA